MVAAWLRVDDASPLVRWEYGQRRPERGRRASIEIVAEEDPPFDPMPRIRELLGHDLDGTDVEAFVREERR